MSGHSKWSTIKRSKGVEDAKRGLTFTKVANTITIVVRLSGSGDPESNPRLRAVLEEAKEVNMPKENIQRAIDRGLGKLPGQVLEEATYEGFGPGKVAFIIETVTDNRMRTLQLIKNAFERAGGSLVGQGAVSYMFEKKGEIKVLSKGGTKDDEMLELIDAGAEDVEDFEDEGVLKYLVYTNPSSLFEVVNKINSAGYKTQSQELVMKPNILQQITDSEIAKKVLNFADILEDNDDVQKVFANFDIDDKLVQLS